MGHEIQCEVCGKTLDNRRLDQHTHLKVCSANKTGEKIQLHIHANCICKECEESFYDWMNKRKAPCLRNEPRGLLWRDGGDCYICPACGEEVSSPARYPGCRCPNCGFQAEKDRNRD